MCKCRKQDKCWYYCLNNNDINTNERLNIQNNQTSGQGQFSEKIEISYEKNELVMLMAGSKSLAKDNKEKVNINQYNLIDTDDPELFDGKIKLDSEEVLPKENIVKAKMNIQEQYYEFQKALEKDKQELEELK